MLKNVWELATLARVSKVVVAAGGSPSSMIRRLRAPTSPPLMVTTTRHFAARSHTRAKRSKGKVKKEEEKKVFLFKKVRLAMMQPYVNQRPVENPDLPLSEDDVFPMAKFRQLSYPFADAIQNLKEICHPTLRNSPQAAVILRVNLDLVYPNRPSKFMDSWKSVIEMPVPFTLKGMSRPSVLAFTIPDNDHIATLLAAGADCAGSKEIIKGIQEGEISGKDYEYIVAHPTIVPDLAVIRGLIKRNFPTIRNRTISTDLVTEIVRLKSGVKVRMEKNDREPDFGYVELPIGTVDMSVEDLESNFTSVLKDTLPRRVTGKEVDIFVVSIVLKVIDGERGLDEVFKLDVAKYLEGFRKSGKSSTTAATEVAEEEAKEKEEGEGDDEKGQAEAVAAAR